MIHVSYYQSSILILIKYNHFGYLSINSCIYYLLTATHFKNEFRFIIPLNAVIQLILSTACVSLKVSLFINLTTGVEDHTRIFMYRFHLE